MSSRNYVTMLPPEQLRWKRRSASGGLARRTCHVRRRFSESQQAEGERQLSRFLGGLQSEMRSIPRTRAERQCVHERITAGFAACGLQMLFGRRMSLTSAIFAYSTLYPYSDNYLDDPAIGIAEKRGFSSRFGQRLAGAEVLPSSEPESAIWRLVALIEGEYQRAQYGQVFASLGMIQRAQERSLLLMRSGAVTDGVDVARLSFEKGGTSALADAYLAAGTLEAGQARICFSLGCAVATGG
jgi:hypothetical protein